MTFWLAVLVYLMNISLFLLFGTIALSMLRTLIRNFEMNWLILLPCFFFCLTIYFGRNVLGYTLQLWDRRIRK